MFYNYFTTAFRNLRRNLRYLLINVLGMGVALGFCILSWFNYDFATTFDRQHRDGERIVRVELLKASTGEPFGWCPGPLAPKALAEISGIEDMTRYDRVSTVVKHGDQVFNEVLTFGDENFFQFFDFTFKNGSADLSNRNVVVIAENIAEKYFGQQDPIGQSLTFYADTDYPLVLTVTGILKKIPLNSSLRFEFLTHLDNEWEAAGKRFDYNSWKSGVSASFLKLKNPADAQAVQTALDTYIEPRNTARPDWTVKGYRLERLYDMAEAARMLRGNELWPGLPPASIWGNGIMSILLLLTAALNFANMTIAVCNRRLREIGVRKVMGGTRRQLVGQMLTESFVVIGLATLLGMILAYPIVDWFNSTWKFTDLKIDYTRPEVLLFVGGMAVFATLLAGSYPAFYISAFQPSSIFRGGILFGGSNLFSRIMMGLQVVISLIGIVVGVSFAQNAEFNRTADIGFEYQPILQAWLPDKQDFKKFNDAVQSIPGVTATAGSVHLPGFGYSLKEIKWVEETHETLLYQVGNGVPAITKMRLVQGEWPEPAGDTTASTSVVVNQMFVREIANSKAVIGETVTFNNQTYRISGVVEDFMTNNPFSPIRPATIHLVPERQYQRCLIRTANIDQQPVIMAAIERQWKTLFPNTPFNVGYQSEMLKEAAEVSANVASSMVVLAGISILLTITGLFSLVSLNILRRLREVSVRRVMGASTGHITWILNKNYLWIFGIAIVIGCVAGYFLSLALMDSIFKINIGVKPSAIVLSALGILLVAVGTIGLKIWQTLRINPAEVLRSEI
jgi:putative ABC transport system permease protein